MPPDRPLPPPPPPPPGWGEPADDAVAPPAPAAPAWLPPAPPPTAPAVPLPPPPGWAVPSPPVPAAPVPPPRAVQPVAPLPRAVEPEAPVAPVPSDVPGLITSVPGLVTGAPRTPVGDTAPMPVRAALVDHVPAVLRPADGLAGAGAEDDDLESTRMVAERTAVPTAPQGAPTAVLRLWDGRRLTLEGPALVGRNPTTRPGEPEPLHRLSIDDPSRSVSKTHLAIAVDLDGVSVTDRGSTNGTVVQHADGSRVDCLPDAVVRVPRNATVRFGRYWFTVG